MDTSPGPYRSMPFFSIYASSNLDATVLLCIPCFARPNQRTHLGDIHHQRAEGFGGHASECGAGIDTVGWSLGRFGGFWKPCTLGVEVCGFETTNFFQEADVLLPHHRVPKLKTTSNPDR